MQQLGDAVAALAQLQLGLAWTKAAPERPWTAEVERIVRLMGMSGVWRGPGEGGVKKAAPPHAV